MAKKKDKVEEVDDDFEQWKKLYHPIVDKDGKLWEIPDFLMKPKGWTKDSLALCSGRIWHIVRVKSPRINPDNSSYTYQFYITNHPGSEDTVVGYAYTEGYVPEVRRRIWLYQMVSSTIKE